MTDPACSHDWREGYYGHDCIKCGAFVVYGQAPWDVPTDEEQARIDAEEYAYSHGTCETCGGEWGDGWSSCRCNREDDEATRRVHKLFMKKLAAEYPRHPWVLKEKSMRWQNPRPVDEWYWMDIELYENSGLLRYGRVSWNRDGTGHYDVSLTVQSERGLGLYCWPSFRVLSDAQDFVERLMAMSVDELMRIHGTQWPGVVL